MIASIPFSKLLGGLLAAAALTLGVSAGASEVGGVKLEPAVRVANQDLKLNGAGIRYRAVFRVYVGALYLPQKSRNVQEILAMPGPRRVTLVMLREINNEELGRAFIAGINQNSDRNEKAKIIPQLQAFGEVFASVPELKKGDTLTTDWIPGQGTVVHLNGRRVSEVIPGIEFYNALLRIWLGEKPADAGLKTAMLAAE